MTDNINSRIYTERYVENASNKMSALDFIDPNITVNIVKKYCNFKALRNDWNALVTSSLFDSIFLRHEWFDAAWQWRKADSELSIITIYLHDVLIGICPLILRCKPHRLGKIRYIEFLTVPDTQYCDVIAPQEHHKIVVRILANWLNEKAPPWDICDLRYLPELSYTPAELCSSSRQINRKVYIFTPDQNHFIKLDTSWANFYKKRSRRLKKGNNLVANHLSQAGEITVDWVRGSDRVLEIIPHIINISAASWKKETGMTLDQPQPGAFIEVLNMHAACQDWLSIWLLYLDGKPIAYEYQLIYKGNIYALRADYDEAFTKLSPGTYLNWQLLQQLFDSQYNFYYLGRGDNSYKLRWTNTAESLDAAIIYGRTFRGHFLHLLEQHARPMLRSLRKFIWKRKGVTQSTKGNRA